MPTDSNPWTITASKTVYENPWIRVREDKVITPTGNQGVYGVLESDDSVMIVALNDRHDICLVRTFRYPDQSWNWELPGGGGDKQDPVAAGERELEEETGLTSGNWELLGKTLVCNGFMTEKMATLLAREARLSGQKEEADEQITQMKFFSLAEIDGMIDSGEINDGQSLTGLMLFKRWQARQKA